MKILLILAMSAAVAACAVAAPDDGRPPEATRATTGALDNGGPRASLWGVRDDQRSAVDGILAETAPRPGESLPARAQRLDDRDARLRQVLDANQFLNYAHEVSVERRSLTAPEAPPPGGIPAVAGSPASLERGGGR